MNPSERRNYIRVLTAKNHVVSVKIAWYNQAHGSLIAKISGPPYYCKISSMITVNISEPCTDKVNALGQITASNTTPRCDEPITLSMSNPHNYPVTWNSADVVINGRWNSGLDISRHNGDKSSAFVTASIQTPCGVRTRSITLNYQPIDPGLIIENNTGRELTHLGFLWTYEYHNEPELVDEVAVSCDGNYSLRMPWVSNQARYTWVYPIEEVEGPGSPTSNIARGRVSSNTSLQFTGNYKGTRHGLGYVMVNGLCADISEFEFTHVLRFRVPRGSAIVLPDVINSCDNTVRIEPILPNAGDEVYSMWTLNGGQQTAKGQRGSFFIFDFPGPGTYQLQAATNCPNNSTLNTTVVIQEGGNDGNTSFSSGLLTISDRKLTGSKLLLPPNHPAPVEERVYFTTEDHKLFYYEYSQAANDWLLYNIPQVTEAYYNPVADIFAPLAYIKTSQHRKLYYVNDNIRTTLEYYDFATETVVPVLGQTQSQGQGESTIHELVSIGNSVYAQDVNGRLYAVNADDNVLTPLNITADLVAIAAHNSLYYFEQGVLKRRTPQGVISTIQSLPNDVNRRVAAKSSLVIYNNHIYYTNRNRGIEQINLSTGVANTIPVQCDGYFAINTINGEIYYQRENYHRQSNVYIARFANNTWTTDITATNQNDQYVHYPVFKTPHVYYINNSRGIMNLYSNPGCSSLDTQAGANQRTALMEETAIANHAVFPNPFEDHLTIQLEQDQENTFAELIDIVGKKVISTKLTGGTNRISTDYLPKGIYLLQVSQNDIILFTEKLVK